MLDYQKILELAKENNGIITTSMVVREGISRGILKYLSDSGALERASRGVYTLPEALEDEFVNISVVRFQVPGQVLFHMRHADPQAAQLEVQERRNAFRPVFVVVSAHGLHRRDRFQLLQDPPAGNVSPVEDAAAPPEGLRDLLPQEVVRVRNNPDPHIPGRLRFIPATQ